MQFIKKHLLRLVFITALLLRIGVMYFDFSFDVLNHISWSKDIVNHGLNQYYETRSSEVYGAEYPNYPPVALYLFTPHYLAYSTLLPFLIDLNVQLPLFPSFIIPFVEDLHFLAALMKIPSILFDMGLALLVGIMGRKLFPKKKNIQVVVSSMILFNLTIFYNSALFGQIDSIPLFFAALGLYYIMFNKRPILAALSLATGVLVKPTILVFFPVLGLLFYRQFGVKKTVLATISSVCFFWIIYLPITIHQSNVLYPFISYKKHVLDAQSVHSVTNAAYNFWALNPKLFFVDAKDFIMWDLTYELVGATITSLIIIALLYKLWQTSYNRFAVFFALGLAAHASFLFLTKINERYLVLALPFLIIPAIKSKSIRNVWIGISILSYLNLYKSWHVPRIDFFVYWLSADIVVIILSAINCVLFAYAFFKFWKYRPQTKKEIS